MVTSEVAKAVNGITNEFLLFVLAVLMILFTSNALWGTIQKYIERRKTKHESTLDERKLEFEIDKFGVETLQKAIVSLNAEQNDSRNRLANLERELALERQARMATEAKNAAMFRYIAKAVSRRRADGLPLIAVDEVDHGVIPEVVDLVR